MCGIFGIVNHDSAAYITYLGLRRMQSRGQESAGIVSAGQELLGFREVGLVKDIITEKTIQSLPGSMAIGHVRYSTSGESSVKEAQPFLVDTRHGQLAVCHNGNLPYADQQRNELKRHGFNFTSTSDTEIAVHLVARSQAATIVGAVQEALSHITGAYSMLFLTKDQLIAVKDPRGIRPLCLGRLNGSWIVASESCPFQLVDAEFVRELKPGEMMVLENGKEPVSYYPFEEAKPSECLFEYVYFARPDSLVFGTSANKARHLMGRKLAEEHPVVADMVVGIPDSGVPAAIGYAKRSGIPFMHAIVRDHYMGRTFIDPNHNVRGSNNRFKHSPISDLIAGQRVVLVDDSIVRANVSKEIVDMVRKAGATEVHLRISSPPTRWPCFYGIDTPSQNELIAANRTEDEVRQFIGADSLGYLSLPGLLAARGDSDGARSCDACFSGTYPLQVHAGGKTKYERELKR